MRKRKQIIQRRSTPEVYAISKNAQKLLRERLRGLPQSHTTIRVYDYIVDYYERSKTSPTYKQIFDAIGLRYENTVRQAIIELVQAGWLEEFRERKNSHVKYRPPAAPYGEKIRDFYLWYRDFYLDHGVLPSYGVCAEALGYKSRGSISKVMKILLENGVVTEAMHDGVGLHQYVPTELVVVNRREFERYKRAYNGTTYAD